MGVGRGASGAGAPKKKKKTQPGDVTVLRRPGKKARQRRLGAGRGGALGRFPGDAARGWRILYQLLVLSLPDAWVLAMPSLLSTPKLVPVIARLRGLSG